MAIKIIIIREKLCRSRLVLKNARTKIHVSIKRNESRFNLSMASINRSRGGTCSWGYQDGVYI